jgi:hypothetical protein
VWAGSSVKSDSRFLDFYVCEVAFDVCVSFCLVLWSAFGVFGWVMVRGAMHVIRAVMDVAQPM